MALKNIEKLIFQKLTHRGRGYVFSGTELLNLGHPAAVRQALSRLAKAGTITRIATGLYYYPRFNKMLGGEIPPSMDTVAQAIARRTDSRIVASGALAANLLGLSTQVPAKQVYLTDGPSRTLSIGRSLLIFRHASPRRMAAKDGISAMVFEAFRYLGREHIGDTVINRLRRNLPGEAKGELRRDLSHASVWMRPLVKRIIETEK